MGKVIGATRYCSSGTFAGASLVAVAARRNKMNRHSRHRCHSGGTSTALFAAAYDKHKHDDGEVQEAKDVVPSIRGGKKEGFWTQGRIVLARVLVIMTLMAIKVKSSGPLGGPQHMKSDEYSSSRVGSPYGNSRTSASACFLSSFVLRGGKDAAFLVTSP